MFCLQFLEKEAYGRLKKILYYSLVDWDWIKQRPQFIALGLAENGFDLRTIYLRQYRRIGLRKVESGKVQLRPIYRIPPFGSRFSLINKVNCWIVRRKVAWEIQRFQPDMIWLTHPSQLADIPDVFNGQIIYDCMDDFSVLGASPASCENARRQEQSLCSRANLIFTSSSILQKKICRQTPDKAQQVHLVRNGCNGKLYPRVTGDHGERIYAGYVGTIAEWFDFDVVLESLERIPSLEYFLIGPVLIRNPPAHDRIHYLGTVAHKNLFNIVKDMDCLIMPFRLVDVVLAVDPVKLYEYISWQKNIITVDYPEIHQFEEFVRRYTDVDEYCAALIEQGNTQLVSYSETDAARFLASNAWTNRVDLIRQKLQEIE